MIGRLMALDVGERTIGIAVSDPNQLIASPLTTVRRSDLASDLASLQKLIGEQAVSLVIVGMPRSLSGELNFQAEKTQRFIEHLKLAIPTPVTTWDERFSTTEADRALIAGGVKRKARSKIIDQTAAAVILQSYMASRPGRAPGAGF
ncbi:MAG: Holliday junction resolvase RuvX [Chloroflexi bacterium]|nr:Holliday junction resolvase RuvX [Chloroflexota bacterium]